MTPRFSSALAAAHGATLIALAASSGNPAPPATPLGDLVGTTERADGAWRLMDATRTQVKD